MAAKAKRALENEIRDGITDIRDLNQSAEEIYGADWLSMNKEADHEFAELMTRFGILQRHVLEADSLGSRDEVQSTGEEARAILSSMRRVLTEERRQRDEGASMSVEQGEDTKGGKEKMEVGLRRRKAG